MKRLIVLALIAAALSVLGVSSLPRSSSAVEGLPADWAPLSSTCYDVSGDGLVDLPNDILGVIQRFNARWGDDNYALVYDVTGGGVIDLPNDVLGTILAFNPSPPSNCSDVDRQVIASAAALLPYQDCNDAFLDGYEETGVYVGNMGIHISKFSNLKTSFDPNNWDDLANPFGLVCSEDPDVPGKADVLIGPWYIIPTTSTGNLYNALPGVNVSPPFQPDFVPPEGFATDEDYIPYNPAAPGVQAGWHTHVNLCVGPGFLTEQGSDGSHGSCKAMGGIVNIPLYGWMLHLYNFVPNPDGRFMRWNTNAAFPRCGHEPNTGGGC